MSYHTIILVGNLGRDPEMRYTPSGKAVTNFSVAVNDGFTDSEGNWVDRAIWFRVSAWGKQAESSNNYLKKGSRVLIDGKLVHENGNPRTFTRNDGSPGASFEVSARTVRFLSSRADDESGYQPGESGNQVAEDDIPF